MRKLILCVPALLLLGATASPARAGEVAIFTGKVGWINASAATAQAQICVDKLTAWGIPVTWYKVNADPDWTDLATWVTAHTGNGQVDALILYGAFPHTIYPAANASVDGSIAELFIESTDGDAIMNHGDAMFYVTTAGSNNGYAGLQNMMDNTAITQAADNTPMTVTPAGKAIASSLTDLWSDRMFIPSQLKNEWYVEAALGRCYDGSRIEPAIFRDGPRGRLIYAYGTNTQDWDPKGAVGAEIVSWIMGVNRGAATAVGFSGGRAMINAANDPRQIVWAGEALTVTVNLLEATGSGTTAAADTTVDLATDSVTGGFYAVSDGAPVTSVTIPAGATYADVLYKDTAAGTPTLTATSAGLAPGTRQVKVFARTYAPAGEVAIYTGKTGWCTKAVADAQAQITASKLALLGVTTTIFTLDTEGAALQSWVTAHTGNGKLDVVVLYGVIPAEIYPAGNASPNGSVAELFIESTDGDAIMNHGDAMFYVTSAGSNNTYTGLQNMIDIPGFLQSAGTITSVVTALGAQVAPSLYNFTSDRPFCVDMLLGNWLVEASLAQNISGGRWGADPVVIREGDRGRIIPALLRNDDNLPKGAVAADIISSLYGYAPADPVQFSLVGRTIGGVHEPLRVTAQVQGLTGSPAKVAVATTVNLATDSATGAFDVSPSGSFNGSVNMLTIPAGSSSAVFFYKDTAAGTPTLTASATGFTSDTLQVTVKGRTFAPAGEVRIYTGATWWIDKAAADIQSQLCADRLNNAGIATQRIDTIDGEADLAAWMTQKTGNGALDVLVIYGTLPASIYPAANAQPEGSIAELFIESPDGDAIMNHGDWMFYVPSAGANNGAAGLQNMMDIPGIGMGADNTVVVATPEGMAIAPSLRSFLTDRPFFTQQLAGNWYVEATLAQNADGTLVEPAVVRDGDKGRLIALFQTNLLDVNSAPDPKGAVSSEVIAWLMGAQLAPTQLALLDSGGASATFQRVPMKVRIEMQDATGIATPAMTSVTVNLSSTSATGLFATSKNGIYGLTSVTIPAGAASATVYYKDRTRGTCTLTATDAGATALTAATMEVTVYRQQNIYPGSVAIYTGTVGWIDKAVADQQAQICVDKLNAAGIPNTWYANATDVEAVKGWVEASIGNDKTDVLVLYGSLPDTIYPPNNTQPDDSLTEYFIESPDGDTIINHADWMFYVFSSGCCNGELGLQSIMDIPGFTLWGDDTPMYVTPEGSEIAPSLRNFWSDRAFRYNLLEGPWYVEAALAQDAFGQRADPVIVRNGSGGRLVPVFQASYQNDPKGAVAAEIITWLMANTGALTPIDQLAGDCNLDGSRDISDIICGVGLLFGGFNLMDRTPPVPPCATPAGNVALLDVNGDANLNVSDIVYMATFLFQGGSPPAQGLVCFPIPVALGCPTGVTCQ